MEAPPTRSDPSRIRVVLTALAAVVLVALFVRGPATSLRPTGGADTLVKVTPTPVTEDFVAVARAGTWSTLTVRAQVNGFNPGAAVFNGLELLVGFTPRVAAFNPGLPSNRAWRQLPPHPAGAVEVGGVTQARGAEVFVYGHVSCPACPMEPSLFALDPDTEVWRQLPDAPGPPVDDVEVRSVGGLVVVVRDRGDAGLEVLAFDPVDNSWADLGAPLLGPLRWQSIEAGTSLVIAGTLSQPDGSEASGAIAWDSLTGEWAESDRTQVVMERIEAAAAVWTGEDVVFLGGTIRPGAHPRQRAQAMALADLTWHDLPPVPPSGAGMPDLRQTRSLDGLIGTYDGERALFLGGLTQPLFLAWDGVSWEVRFPDRPRAGGTALWAGDRVLVWGGFDRGGPIQDVSQWPATPGVSPPLPSPSPSEPCPLVPLPSPHVAVDCLQETIGPRS